MMHEVFVSGMDGQLYFAPIGETPTRVLDIGTGTGIWAIQFGWRYIQNMELAPANRCRVGDKFPAAQVVRDLFQKS